MKRSSSIFILLALLVIACQPKTAPMSTPVLASSTPFLATDTPEATLIHPTQLPEPTSTPEIINLPPVIGKTPPHPMALNESNVATKMRRLNIYGTGALQDIKFSPDGKYLAAATKRGIYIYDGRTFESIGFIDVNDSVLVIAFSPDSSVIAAAIQGRVSLWNVLSGQKMLDLNGGMVTIRTLIYGKNGYIAASGSDCLSCEQPYVQAAILWDAQTGRQIYAERNILGWSDALAFSDAGKKLAFFGPGQEGITILDFQNEKSISNSKLDVEYPSHFIFGKDGYTLFVTSGCVGNANNYIVNTATKEITTFPFCASYITRTDDMGVCPMGMGTEIVFFDLSTGQKISSINPPDFNIGGNLNSNTFAINPSGDLLAYSTSRYKTYGDRNILHIFNIETGTEVKTLFFDGFHNIQAGIVLLDGKEKLVGVIQDQPSQFYMVDLETGATLRTFKLDDTEIESFGLRPDYKTIITIDRNKKYVNTLTFWDIQSQKIIYQKIWPEDVAHQVAFSPDGLDILLTSWPGLEAFAFNLSMGTSSSLGSDAFPYSYEKIEFANDRYHFNPQGNLVILGYQGAFPAFTDSKTKQSIVIPYKVATDADMDRIGAFALSPDGKFVAFSSNISDIFIWDLETLRQVSTLSGHVYWDGAGDYQGKVRSLIFSPQSNLLVSVGWDETTRLWNIQTGQELRRLNVCCSAAFTPDGRFLVTAGDGVLRIWGIP